MQALMERKKKLKKGQIYDKSGPDNSYNLSHTPTSKKKKKSRGLNGIYSRKYAHSCDKLLVISGKTAALGEDLLWKEKKKLVFLGDWALGPNMPSLQVCWAGLEHKDFFHIFILSHQPFAIVDVSVVFIFPFEVAFLPSFLPPIVVVFSPLLGHRYVDLKTHIQCLLTANRHCQWLQSNVRSAIINSHCEWSCA